MEKENDVYAGKIDIEDRILLFICGIFFFPAGIALYYFFLDKKNKEYHAQFAKSGAIVGLGITFFFLLLGLLLCLSQLLGM